MEVIHAVGADAGLSVKSSSLTFFAYLLSTFVAAFVHLHMLHILQWGG